jgi:hypothetical protein
MQEGPHPFADLAVEELNAVLDLIGVLMERLRPRR